MLIKQINRLQQIDQLIRQKRTGNADEFAEKLNLSRRQVYNWINELKNLGFEIEYKREIKSYIYLKPYQLTITLDNVQLSIANIAETDQE